MKNTDLKILKENITFMVFKSKMLKYGSLKFISLKNLKIIN